MRGPRRTRRQQVIAVIIALTLGLPALFGIAVVAGLIITPPIDDMPKRVDTILKEHGGDRVPLTQVPDQLSEALIAIEDERFYQHRGMDTQGLIRALLTDLYHHRALEGGSTLTQQLIKLLYRNPCSARARQFNVLAQMAHDGYISQEQAAAAYNESIGFPCKY